MFILKFREIFHGENECSGPTEWNLMKNCFFCHFMQYFEEKWNMLWLPGSVLYLWRVLKIFLNPRLSLIVPLNLHLKRMQHTESHTVLFFFFFLTLKKKVNPPCRKMRMDPKWLHRFVGTYSTKTSQENLHKWKHMLNFQQFTIDGYITHVQKNCRDRFKLSFLNIHFASTSTGRLFGLVHPQ